jgi:hypothetical protein
MAKMRACVATAPPAAYREITPHFPLQPNFNIR